MPTVKEIEKAFAELPPEKLSVFRSWFEKFDAALWDKQFEVDVKAGKLEAIATKVRESFKKGKSKEL